MFSDRRPWAVPGTESCFWRRCTPAWLSSRGLVSERRGGGWRGGSLGPHRRGPRGQRDRQRYLHVTVEGGWHTDEPWTAPCRLRCSVVRAFDSQEVLGSIPKLLLLAPYVFWLFFNFFRRPRNQNVSVRNPCVRRVFFTKRGDHQFVLGFKMCKNQECIYAQVVTMRTACNRQK